MLELIKKHNKLAAKTHISTKVTKSLYEAQEPRGMAKNAVLGAELGSESRWSGHQHSFRQNNILEAGLTEVRGVSSVVAIVSLLLSADWDRGAELGGTVGRISGAACSARR